MIISTAVLNKLQWECNLHPEPDKHLKSRKTGRIVSAYELSNGLPCVGSIFDENEPEIVVVRYNSVLDEAMVSSDNAETGSEVFTLLA